MADPSGSPGELFASPLDAGTPAMLARLPVGRHGLPREFVAANQRSRLLSAALEVFTARGYPAASVADIVKAAGVSRNAFYSHFADKEACLLATADAAVAWLGEQASGAWACADDWARRVIAVVDLLTALLAEDPRLGRLLTIELLRAGPPARCRHEATLARLAAGLRSGRALGGPAASMPLILDCSLVAGAVSVITRRLAADQGGQVAGLGPELSEILLAPYVGSPAAHELVSAADWHDREVSTRR